MKKSNLRLIVALLLSAALFAPLSLHSAVLGVPVSRGGQLPGGSGLNFKLSGPQVLDGYIQARAQMQASLQGILAVPADQRDFANTIKAFETASAVFGEQVNALVFLAYVSPDAEVQAAAQMVEEDAGKDNVALMSREDLYAAVTAAAAKNEALIGEDAKLRDSTMRAFKSSGLELPAPKREQLRQMQERLSALQTKFSGNVNAFRDGMNLSLEDLAGLPQDYIAGLPRTEDGKYRVTLSYPDYLPFMKYAESGALRQQLQLKYNNRAVEKNLPILAEALKLRGESAKLLGYESYPAMAIEGRMAENPGKVWAFLNKLWPILRGQGDSDLKALLEVKRQKEPSAQRVESWETSYLGDKLRKQRYDLDSEEVKKYFPVDRVVEGTMKVYQRVLGVDFKELPPDAWHKDVRLFEIADKASGRRIGHFYLDLFPREGKYGHAAAFTIVQGRELEGGDYRETVSAMVANFPKASGDAPALLPHSDVETFFHEFGHLMHQTLTKARYASFAGSSVAMDFVEAPSQMLENFVWQKEVLDEISGHYQDPSRKLPDALFQKMLAAKNFNNGLHYLGQLAYAMIDMVFHTAVPAETSTIFNQMMEIIGLVPVQPGSHSEASFGHLMGGYGAGYYSYLWSEVFADDIFSRFAKEGVFNPEVGMAWRKEVLEKGSSRPEMESLKAFLGREPSEEAFLKKMRGETPAKPAS